MKTVIFKVEKESSLKLLSGYARKIGLKPHILSNRKREDIALRHAIDEGMKSEKLPVQSAYRILDKLSRSRGR